MNQTQFTLDSLLSLINHMNHLNAEEKRELRFNCEYAIRCFGKDWETREESRSHPLWGFFGFSIGILLLGKFGEALQNLKKKENFHEIVKRLHHKDQFEGAFSEIMIGNNLLKAGIQFQFLKPNIRKTPDIVLDYSGKEINLEITEKETSAEYQRASMNLHEIDKSLHSLPNNCYFFYQIHKPLSSSRTEDILQKCQKMKYNVSTTGFEEYHKSGIIDLYIFKRENEQKVPIEHRTISAQLPITDDIRRLKVKISNKSKQLCDEKAGILVVVDNDFWPGEDEKQSNLNLKNNLEEHICDYKNISAFVIINNFAIADIHHTEFLVEEEYFISMMTYNPKTLFTTNKIIIFNEYAKNPLSQEERELVKIL